jgi:hypothetical protein
MKGITWLDRQAVMVIVAEPAGNSNGSDWDRPTPTMVTVEPSTETPGESAGVAGALVAGGGVGVAVGAADPQAATAGITRAVSSSTDDREARRVLTPA